MSRKIVVQIQKDQVKQFFTPITYEKIHTLGHVVWNPHSGPSSIEELKEQLQDAHTIITTWGSIPLSDELLESAHSLRVIAHMAGSVKQVLPTEKVFERDIRVLNSNFAIAVSVSESVLALILALGHNIIKVNRAMKSGNLWQEDSMQTFELRGKTVGLVGLGMVARELIKLLQPFQVKVLACDPYISTDTAKALNIELLSLPELLRQSNIISLHAPAVPETYHLIGKHELAMIQDGAMLINTARGTLIDQEALIAELRNGRLHVALDVFEKEPLEADSELRKMDNVIIRPHLAGVNSDSRLRIGTYMIDDLERLYNGEPVRFEVKKEQLKIMT